jgi:hypothetical protein
MKGLESVVRVLSIHTTEATHGWLSVDVRFYHILTVVRVLRWRSEAGRLAK